MLIYNMIKWFKEKSIHGVFVFSLLLKGANALIEIIGGSLLFFISQNYIINLTAALTQDELSEDPKDLVANTLVKMASGFSVNAQHFFALYLLVHGVIKSVLIVGLLRNKHWAYPSALIVFALFIIYQIYRFAFTKSVWLLVLTIFDLLVIWLVWKEYCYHKNLKNFNNSDISSGDSHIS